MGKDVSFYMYLANIYNKVDVQTSKLVNDETKYGVFDT